MRFKNKIPDSKTISLTDFSKGALNLPENSIPAGGFFTLSNAEYDPTDNSLSTSPGLTLVQATTQSSNIDSFFYSDVLESYFFSAGGSVYETNLSSTPALLGTLTGSNPAKYHHFDGKLFITSGGTVQYYDGSTLTTMTVPTVITIESITFDGLVATVTTATAHGLIAGTQIVIAGASPSQYNGTFLIASVPTPVASATTFTYTLLSTPTYILQVETATVVGTITSSGAGNVSVTVTGTLIGSNTFSVAVADSDTASQVAALIYATLSASTTITKYYTVTNPSANPTTIVLTFIYQGYDADNLAINNNDSTLNIATATGTAIGLTSEPTSVNTTAGTSGNAVTVGYYTITNNFPVADSLIDRDGRLELTKIGNDDQVYSAVGAYKDVADWTNNSNDTSSAFTQPVGYKDSASTVASIALSTDIMVFKTPKRAYRIVGDPASTVSSYAIYEMSRDLDVINENCVCLVDNNVFVFGSSGFDAIQTVQAYGDVQKVTPSVGGTWNTFFRQNMDITAKIWNVESRSQIWIKWNNTGEIAIFHYHLGGVFSFRTFENALVDVAENDETVYLAIGKSIYKLDTTSSTTETENITTSMVFGKTGSIHDFVLSWFKFSLYNDVPGNGSVIIGDNVNGNDLTVSFASSNQSPIAYTNTIIAYLNTDIAFSGSLPLSVQQFCNYRVSALQPKIQIAQGRFTLREIKMIVGDG